MVDYQQGHRPLGQEGKAQMLVAVAAQNQRQRPILLGRNRLGVLQRLFPVGADAVLSHQIEQTLQRGRERQQDARASG